MTEKVSHLSLQFLVTGTSWWLLHMRQDSGSLLHSLWQYPYHSVSEVWTSRTFDCTPSENNNNLVIHWSSDQYRCHINRSWGTRLDSAGYNKVLDPISLLCDSRKYKITFWSHWKTVWGIKIKQVTNTQRILVKYTRAIQKQRTKFLHPNSIKLIKRTDLHQIDLRRTEVCGGGTILQEQQMRKVLNNFLILRCCWSGRLQHLRWLQKPSNMVKYCIHFHTHRDTGRVS